MAQPTQRSPLTAGDQVCQDIFVVTPGGGTILSSFDSSAADPPAVEFAVPQDAVAIGILVNVTAISGAGAQTIINVDGFDKTSKTWFPMLASAALTTVAQGAILKFGPMIQAAANTAYNGPLFETMRVRPTKGGTTTTLTFSIGATFS